jgi:hypothetical protein
MIRVRYSDNTVTEHKSVDDANFMILNSLFTSKGKVVPVEAVEVMGITTGGVSVERELNIKAAALELDW